YGYPRGAYLYRAARDLHHRVGQRASVAYRHKEAVAPVDYQLVDARSIASDHGHPQGQALYDRVGKVVHTGRQHTGGGVRDDSVQLGLVEGPEDLDLGGLLAPRLAETGKGRFAYRAHPDHLEF